MTGKRIMTRCDDPNEPFVRVDDNDTVEKFSDRVIDEFEIFWLRTPTIDEQALTRSLRDKEFREASARYDALPAGTTEQARMQAANSTAAYNSWIDSMDHANVVSLHWLYAGFGALVISIFGCGLFLWLAGAL